MPDTYNGFLRETSADGRRVTSDIPFECVHGGNKIDCKRNEQQRNEHKYDCDDSRLFCTWTDRTNARHTHKQADVTARSIKVSQTLMITTIEDKGGNEDGDNEAGASDDNTDEQDGEVHPDDEIKASTES